MTAELHHLAESIQQGDRRALAQAITLVESTRPEHRRQAANLLEQLAPLTGRSFRLGISGPPGVGKSTFIEAIGLYAIQQGRRVAVLSVDPSSAVSGGSILGDKTRMEELSRRDEAFIRPSPAGQTLGGVARRSREAVSLCEAAGFDMVMVETVGVGQSETAVANMTDMFLLLLMPGGGDELQGIKRGVMELADMVIVNKADGAFLKSAKQAAVQLQLALGLLRPVHAHWQTPVLLCSALTGAGIAEVWRNLVEYQQSLSAGGELADRRARQAQDWFREELSSQLLESLQCNAQMKELFANLQAEVAAGRLAPALAAAKLLESFLPGS